MNKESLLFIFLLMVFVPGFARAENPYEILGVSETAGEKEIKTAFRQLVRKLHPDQNSHDRQAAAKFIRVVEANDVLKDPSKRRALDRALAEQRKRDPKAQASETITKPSARSNTGQTSAQKKFADKIDTILDSIAGTWPISGPNLKAALAAINEFAPPYHEDRLLDFITQQEPGFDRRILIYLANYIAQKRYDGASLIYKDYQSFLDDETADIKAHLAQLKRELPNGVYAYEAETYNEDLYNLELDRNAILLGIEEASRPVGFWAECARIFRGED